MSEAYKEAGGCRAVNIVNGCNFTLENLIIKNCSDSGNEKTAIYNDGMLTLKNCVVTDNLCCGVFNSGILKLEGKTVIDGNTYESNPLNLYLDSNCTINDITNLSSASRIGVSTAVEPKPASPVTLTDVWFPVFGNPWNVFKADDQNYFIDIDAGDSTKVVLKKQGAAISFGEDNLSFHVQNNENGIFFTLCKNDNPVDGSISVVSKTLKCGADTVLQSTTNSAVSVSENTVRVNVSSLESGNYILYLSFTYKGLTYDVSLPFTK